MCVHARVYVMLSEFDQSARTECSTEFPRLLCDHPMNGQVVCRDDVLNHFLWSDFSNICLVTLIVRGVERK